MNSVVKCRFSYAAIHESLHHLIDQEDDDDDDDEEEEDQDAGENDQNGDMGKDDG